MGMGPGGGVVFVDEVGEFHRAASGVVQCHEEVGGRQQPADDGMDAGDHGVQVAVDLRRLGNLQQRGLHRLGALKFGDVVGHRNAHALVLGPARRPLDVDHAAVLADIAVAEMQLGLAVHDLARRLQGALAVVRVHQVDQRFAQHLGGAVAEDALVAGIDIQVASLRIDHADRVEQQVHDGGKRRVIGFHQLGLGQARSVRRSRAGMVWSPRGSTPA